jgi:predicted nucleic acid-binding protein
VVLAPPLLFLELVDVAARRWGWEQSELVELVELVATLRFEVVEPDLPQVARWAGRGLTAYDASYIALAEAEAATLVTEDEVIVATAPRVTRSLSGEDRRH